MRSRRALSAALVSALLAVAALAGVALWRASQPAATTAEGRVHAVTSTLRCPACDGQSVAESSSDMAAQMRTVVSDQLARGRTPAQVRAWFAQRYGDSVLLDPPWRGPGLWLQLLPAVVLAAGLLGVLAVRRPAWRRRIGAAAVGALAATVVALAAVALQRDDPAPATDPVQQAAGLLAQGRAADAERVVRPALATSPDPRVLLVHGLAQRQLGDAAWSTSLREFLRRAPHDPAAARVKRLLAGSGD